jgi:hypothetical protein
MLARGKRRALLAIVGGLLVLPGSASAATEVFSYTGAVQPWTVPDGVSRATFELYGSQGGDSRIAPDTAGKGARVTATLFVSPGETLSIRVGGRNGWNGGELGGGGATDVRRGVNLTDRLLVAGGGGGGRLGGDSGARGQDGGIFGASPGSGATAEGPGIGGCFAPFGQCQGGFGGNGSLGQGGIGDHGGGGGLWGGGGSGYGPPGYQEESGGGGGGSSLSWGPAVVPGSSSVAEGVRLGAGEARVTYTTPGAPPSTQLPDPGPSNVGAQPGGSAKTGSTVQAPVITGSTSSGPAQSSLSGSFTVPKQFVDCSGPGPDCVVTTSAGTIMSFSKARKVVLGRSRFTVEAGRKDKVTTKLTRSGLEILKRERLLKVTVMITVKRGTATAKRSLGMTLRAPKPNRRK